MSHPRRALVILLVIAAMLSVFASSVSAAHTHPKDLASRCDICCAAHLAVGQTAHVKILHALAIRLLPAQSAETQREERLSVFAFLTRGPPRSL